MRFRLLKRFLVLAFSTFAAIPANAYNEDVHYQATFVLAVSLGMTLEQALTIASANQAVDENLFTKPTEQVGTSPSGRNEPDQKRILFLPVYIGLSLQDYYFHCFSPEKDIRGQPHVAVSKHLETLETKAMALIDRGRKSDDPKDKSSALIAIGVYLHCLQDSWSHSGYGGNPMGHVRDNLEFNSPDDTHRYPENTKGALVQTVDKLIAFAAMLGRETTGVSNEDISLIFRGLTEAPNIFFRETCNKDILEYWLRKMVDLHPSIDGKLLRRYDMRVISQIEKRTVNIERGDKYELLHDVGCSPLFEIVFPEIIAAYKLDIIRLLNVSESTLAATLSALRLPTKRLPLLEVRIAADPTFRQQPDVYDIFRQ